MIWPPPERALEGRRVRLEPLADRHREPLAAIADVPECWAWTDRRVPGSRPDFDAWFDARLAARGAGREYGFANLDPGGGGALGSSSYLNPRPEHDGVEIGWTWLHPSAWGGGANVEAKLLMLGFAFDELGAMRVEFKTDSRNERSRGAIEALPAQFEGIHRKHMVMPRIGVRDSAYYSITDQEWPAVLETLTARLASQAEEGNA